MRQLHRSIVIIAIVTCVGTCLTATIVRADGISRGHELLLKDGLQVQSLVYSYANFSSVPEWKTIDATTFNFWEWSNPALLSTLPTGQQWSRLYDTAYSYTKYLSAGELPYTGTLVSYQYGDEMSDLTTSARMSDMVSTFAQWRQDYPNALLYTNCYAGQYSTAQLQTYMQTVQPDMIMFDNYPGFSFTTSARNNWYSTMQQYRTLGLAGNDGTGSSPIPYGQYLDLYRTSQTGALPSESFVRMQIFASWAFGYTYTTDFIYNSASGTGLYPAVFNTDDDSQPNAVFGYVTEANRESQNLGPALVRLLSTDIRMIPGSGHSVNGTGITAWAAGANGGNDYLTAITPTATQGGAISSTFSDILVGYFKPLQSTNNDYPFAYGTHFMIVNAASQGTAAAAAQWYHLTFDFGTSPYKELEMIDNNTGHIVVVPLTHISGTTYSLDINLSGGTGELFRYYTGIPGDFNDDGKVDMADYTMLTANWQHTTPYGADAADLNGDGIVNLLDFVLFRQDYMAANGGAGSDLQPPVPEPASLTLLLIAAIVLIAWRNNLQKT